MIRRAVCRWAWPCAWARLLPGQLVGGVWEVGTEGRGDAVSERAPGHANLNMEFEHADRTRAPNLRLGVPARGVGVGVTSAIPVKL